MRMLHSLQMVSLLAALPSCSPKPESALVGKWFSISPAQTVEFRADGVFDGCIKGWSFGCYAGKYTFDGRALQFSSPTAQPPTILSLSASELVYKLGNGPVVKLTRAPTSTPGAGIVGKWIVVDTTQTLEFFKDGTVNVVGGGASAAGNYKFVDEKRLRLDLGGVGLAKSQLYGIAVSTNELTLTDDHGQASMFIRAP